jgi:putative flippase GtrA
MLRKEVIEGVRFRPLSWKVLAEILIRGRYRHIVELPYTFLPRAAGTSKLTSRESFNYLIHLLHLVLDSPRDRRFFFWALVGASGFCIDFGLYGLAIHFGTPVVITGAASALCAMVWTFTWNDLITWRHNRHVHISVRAVKYATVSLVAIAISTTTLALTYQSLHFHPLVAKLLGITLAAIWNYMLNSRWTWKEKPSRPVLVTQGEVSLTPRRLSIVVPAYNEARRLKRSLPAFFSYLDSLPGAELILANDGSTDGTLDLMHAAAKQRDYVKVVTYERNRGKGRAVATGIAASSGDIILVTDVDLSVPLCEMPHLLPSLQGRTGAVIASRVALGAQVSQPLIRRLGGRALNLFIQASFLPGLRDTQCGFKLFDGSLARQVFAQSRIDGFAFDVEALWRVRREGRKVQEIGVKWVHDEDSRVAPLRHTLQITGDLMRLRFGLI